MTLSRSDDFYHAFRREPDGTVTLFDAPFSEDAQNCGATAIKTHEDIVGDCKRSFRWALADGVFHKLEVPGTRQTIPLTITDQGHIGGTFCRIEDTRSGFILANGVYQQIDVPGASYTEVSGIDAKRQRIVVNARVGENLQAYVGKKAPAVASR
jgi:hypothetical protein